MARYRWTGANWTERKRFLSVCFRLIYPKALNFLAKIEARHVQRSHLHSRASWWLWFTYTKAAAERPFSNVQVCDALYNCGYTQFWAGRCCSSSCDGHSSSSEDFKKSYISHELCMLSSGWSVFLIQNTIRSVEVIIRSHRNDADGSYLRLTVLFCSEEKGVGVI